MYLRHQISRRTGFSLLAVISLLIGCIDPGYLGEPKLNWMKEVTIVGMDDKGHIACTSPLHFSSFLLKKLTSWHSAIHKVLNSA
jgi:hypothetical protein